MSSVTNVILVTAPNDGGGDDEYPNADLLTGWLQENHGLPDRLVRVDQYAGGTKHMQCDVFLAGINYLDHEGFLERFHSIPWEMPDCVWLMLKCEQDGFTIYRPGEDV